MGRSKDLSDFDKDQIVMARRLGQSISETVRLVGGPTDSGPRRDKPQTGDRVLGAQWSSMREGNKSYPVWSELTEGLLWHKSQVTENFNCGHGRNVSQSTVHRTLLRMGLRSRRPVRVPMMTPVHH